MAALASDEQGSVLRTWDAETGKVVRDFAGPTKWLHGLAFSPDGALVASCASGFPQPPDYKPPHTVRNPDGTIDKGEPHREGDWLPWACRIQVWHAQTGAERCLLPGYQDAVTCLCFSPDGQFLASGATGGRVKVWDLRTQQVVVTLAGHGGDVRGLAFSPDGKRLATALGRHTEDFRVEGEVNVWDVGEYLRP